MSNKETWLTFVAPSSKEIKWSDEDVQDLIEPVQSLYSSFFLLDEFLLAIAKGEDMTSLNWALS